MPERHFRLLDHVGLDAAGNPEPIHEVGLTVRIPVMKAGELVDVEERTTVKPAAGTRLVKTDDPRIAEGLVQCGMFEEVDAPTKKDIAKDRSATTDAREGAANSTPDGEEKGS